MRNFTLRLIAFISGIAFAVFLEPKALVTNTCYHNSIHQSLKLELYVAFTGSEEYYKIDQPLEIYSWREKFNQLLNGVHYCEK